MTEPAALPRFVIEPAAVIIEVVSEAEPALDVVTIAAVIAEVTPTRARQRELARALSGDRDLLTSGRPAGPRTVERLIRKLRAIGATNVVLPRCAGCDKPNRLPSIDDHGRRICGACAQRPRAVWGTCGSCGEHRRFASHDRHGTGRCVRCPPEADQDHTAVICDHIDQLAGETNPELLRSLVQQAIPQPFQRRSVSWELDYCPELLTGRAAHGSPRLVALVELLVRHNVSGVVAVNCPFCGRQATLKFRRDGQRCCRRCYDEARTQTCGGCGRTTQVTTRTLDGRPQCSACTKTDPVNHERCTGCDRVRLIAHRDGDQVLCHTCWRGHHAVCSVCGQTKPCYFAFSDAPRCQNCSRKPPSPQPCARCGRNRLVWTRDPDGHPLCDRCGRGRAPCCRCGRTMAVKGTVADGPLCRTCYKSEPAYFQHCVQCDAFERLHHFGLCQRCACPPLLRQALAGHDDQVRPELEPVIQVLLASDPFRLLFWLTRPSTHTILASLAIDQGAVTHAVLDRLTPTGSVKRLRDTLVAGKFLPARDEYLIALQRWLDAQLATIDDPAERRLLRGFVTWFHLRRQRRRSPITYNQASFVKQDVRKALALLTWLRQRGQSLGTCTQDDIDTWLAENNNSQLNARNFLTWAVRHGAALDVEIPARQPRYKHEVFPETDDRWSITHRLLHDNKLDVVDRVAGLLVLLYAQPLTRIAPLTTRHVTHTDNGVQLNLGPNPLELPTPLDELLLRLVHKRHGYAVFGHTEDHPWLFPGGSPGRHMTAQQLMRRLQKLDISARLGRNTALMDLASQLPAAIISQLLGLNISTATKWGTTAGNTHHGYAAHLAEHNP